MKIFTSSFLLLIVSFFTYAQVPVDTFPHNKNVLIEEFTGVECNSCPQGHIEIANLIAAYPDRVFAAGMHSFSTGHTTPYPGDQDLRRRFPDSLRTKISDLSGIPAGIINRRNFGGKESFIFWPFTAFHHPIDSVINIVLNEPSPFNIGLIAEYDTINKILQIKTSVYSTQNVLTVKFNLNVYFTESNIYVSQLNGTTVIPDYCEKHVFRQMITPTWGLNITPSGISKGATLSTEFFYVNDSNYKMENVEVIGFVTDQSNTSSAKGIVVQATGVQVKLTGATNITNRVRLVDPATVYPNPTSGQFYIHLNHALPNEEVMIKDLNGKIVYRKPYGMENPVLIESYLVAGIYFLSLSDHPGWIKKIAIN